MTKQTTISGRSPPPAWELLATIRRIARNPFGISPSIPTSRLQTAYDEAGMRYAAVVALLLTAGCGRMPKPIEFLTRSGCVQTEIMRARTEQAIKKLDLKNPVSIVDLDTLAAGDARRGYPTPTVLVDRVDLFGMPTPTPPFPDPT